MTNPHTRRHAEALAHCKADHQREREVSGLDALPGFRPHKLPRWERAMFIFGLAIVAWLLIAGFVCWMRWI